MAVLEELSLALMHTLLPAATLSHANSLVEVIEQPDLDSQTRRNHMNAVKMTAYLLCQFVDVFETDAVRQATAVAHTAKVCIVIVTSHTASVTSHTNYVTSHSASITYYTASVTSHTASVTYHTTCVTSHLQCHLSHC